jgi:hypothetical protein
MEKMNRVLDGYAFKGRNSASREAYIKKASLNNLLITEFFSSKLLHFYKDGNSWLPMELMSSGERQKAMVDIIYSLLYFNEEDINEKPSRRSGNKKELNLKKADASHIILAIDEPDSSLHISACFEQFSRLKKISDVSSQVLFTSHWYGYIPYLQDGTTSFIGTVSLGNEEHNSAIILNNSSPAECVKDYERDYKEISIPVPVGVKGVSDLSQAIMHGAAEHKNCTYVICEGSSDKVYLDYYFENEIKDSTVRVVPVGGVVNLKRVYLIVSSFFPDFKNSMNNKILFISDTDAQLVDNTDIAKQDGMNKKVEWFRLMVPTSSSQASIYPVSDVMRYGVTTIEDALNGNLFHKALLSCKEQLPTQLRDHLELCSNVSNAIPSHAMSLPPQVAIELKGFFDDRAEGSKRKFYIAKRYVELARETRNTQQADWVPQWIDELRSKM